MVFSYFWSRSTHERVYAREMQFTQSSFQYGLEASFPSQRLGPG
jgi:hypothetical protein